MSKKTGGYKIELSPNNGAACQGTECKKTGVKIMKNEVRFSTLAGHESWRWCHWQVKG
jgi:hypothetical protein